MIDVYGIDNVSILSKASTNIISGFIFKFEIALVRASFVAFKIFISSILVSSTIPTLQATASFVISS